MKYKDLIKPDVLIADDNPEICEILKEHCESLGCFRNIVVANDGILTMLKIKNQKFDVIILDINMPKKSGKLIAEELASFQQINKISSVLILSGEIDKDLINDCVKLGVKHFLTKPFDQLLLIKKIKDILKIK